MRSTTLALLALLLAAPSATAAGWSRTFDSGTSWDEVAWAGPAPGGGHLVAGATDVLPGRFGDGAVARLDDGGRLLGATAYGTPEREGIAGAAPLQDGGVVLCGATTFQFDFRPGVVARLARDGSLAWSRALLAPGALQVTTAFAATQLSDQRIVVAGSYSEIDAPPRYAFVVALNPDGSLSWQRMLTAGLFEQAQAVAEAADGGILVAGLSASPGSAGDSDAWVVKLTSAGDLEWAGAWGGAGRDEATGIAATPDGGAVVAGSTDSFTTSAHAPWILRLGADGALAWHVVAGDLEWGEARGIATTADGGAVVLGRLDVPGGISIDMWLAKLDALGASAWQRAFDSGQGDWGVSVGRGADGGLVVGGMAAWGFAEQDAWLLHAGDDGTVGCPQARTVGVGLASPRVEHPPSDVQFVPVEFTLPDAGWTAQQLPVTEAVQCDACADAGGAPPEEPSAGRPRAPWLTIAKVPSERVNVEEVAGATALNLYVGRIGTWYAPTLATGTRCRETSWTGAGTVAVETDLPAGSWVVVAASNACGESSAGRDSFGVERRSLGAWEPCPPGP